MISFGDIQKVNDGLKTIDIKDKNYTQVVQRIKGFRMLYPEGTISTEMLFNDGKMCIFKATVSIGGLVLGTGTAYEQEGSSLINKTSYIENCETSAVGRALAMCGIGIDTSLASYEEVANAENNQPKLSKEEMMEEVELRAKVLKYINKIKMSKENVEKLCKAYKVASISEMTAGNCKDYLKKLEEKGVNVNE